jgi:N-formylglutamate amidohydrolase
MATPLLLHIPHSSIYIPKNVREHLILSDSELELELLRMTDRYTDLLFDVPEIAANSIIYPVSRLVVDPERFENDEQEIMAGIGMGVIYTTTSQKKVLRAELDASERMHLLDAFYRPHHRRFTDKVTMLLHEAGQVLIIDCHSFPSKPLPYEPSQDEHRPDICIGSDLFHTPAWLLETMKQSFEGLGYQVAINHPFRGAIVPLSYYQKDTRVMSIMIEINRKLYMHEATGKKHSNFNNVRDAITTVVTHVCETLHKKGEAYDNNNLSG